MPEGASALDFALASAANAFGFGPRFVNRDLRLEDQQLRRQSPITNFPQSGGMWYTDGGTIDNEPLGRTLDLSNKIDQNDPGDFRRLHLLIHPHPTMPPGSNDQAWADPHQAPRWLASAGRAFAIHGAQGIYDDLRRVQKTNSRLIWKQELLDVLRTSLTDSPALDDLLRSADEEKTAIQSRRGVEVLPPSQPDGRDTLERLVDLVGGLAGKRTVLVDDVSPRLVLDDPSSPLHGRKVEDILAGEFLMHFGGFLDESLRESDFALGFMCMLRWVRESLSQLLDPVLIAEVADEVAALYDPTPHFNGGALGNASLRNLNERSRKSASTVMRQISDVVLHETQPWTGKTWTRRALFWVISPVMRRLPAWLLRRFAK